MKNTTIGKIQIVLGIIFLVLVLIGGVYVIKNEILGSHLRAVEGITENWGENDELMLGQMMDYGLMVRVGISLAILICLNGLIISSLLITQGLKNIKDKK